MRLATRAGLVLVLLTGILLVAVAGAEHPLEILAVLLLLGLLVVRELLSGYSTTDFRGRFDVFIWSGLALFVLIVIRRVRDVLGL